MLRAEAVEGAKPPALEVREDPVDPQERDMRRGGVLPAPEHDRKMLATRDVEVRVVAVGVELAARRGVLLHERMDERRLVLCDRLEADPARLVARKPLDRADHEDLADGALSLSAGDRVGLLAERDRGLIDLDFAREWRSIRIDHRAAQLVEQQPRGLVGAQAE